MNKSTLLRQLPIIVIVAVCVVAIARLWTLTAARQPQVTPIELASSQWQSDPVAQLSARGIEVDRLVFDDSAAVLLTLGPDGKPGQADGDDNRDGVVDDAAEIGAVGSDDQCLAPWDREYAAARQQGGSVVISRGTFRRSEDDDDPGREFRFLLQSPDQSWIVIP